MLLLSDLFVQTKPRSSVYRSEVHISHSTIHMLVLFAFGSAGFYLLFMTFSNILNSNVILDDVIVVKAVKLPETESRSFFMKKKNNVNIQKLLPALQSIKLTEVAAGIKKRRYFLKLAKSLTKIYGILHLQSLCDFLTFWSIFSLCLA